MHLSLKAIASFLVHLAGPSALSEAKAVADHAAAAATHGIENAKLPNTTAGALATALISELGPQAVAAAQQLVDHTADQMQAKLAAESAQLAPEAAPAADAPAAEASPIG